MQYVRVLRKRRTIPFACLRFSVTGCALEVTRRRKNVEEASVWRVAYDLISHGEQFTRVDYIRPSHPLLLLRGEIGGDHLLRDGVVHAARRREGLLGEFPAASLAQLQRAVEWAEKLHAPHRGEHLSRRLKRRFVPGAQPKLKPLTPDLRVFVRAQPVQLLQRRHHAQRQRVGPAAVLQEGQKKVIDLHRRPPLDVGRRGGFGAVRRSHPEHVTQVPLARREIRSDASHSTV